MTANMSVSIAAYKYLKLSLLLLKKSNRVFKHVTKIDHQNYFFHRGSLRKHEGCIFSLHHISENVCTRNSIGIHRPEIHQYFLVCGYSNIYGFRHVKKYTDVTFHEVFEALYCVSLSKSLRWFK